MLSGCPAVGVAANVKRHAARQSAQAELRTAMAEWGGVHRADDREMQRRFWYTFGVDVVSAQALGADEASTLRERVRNALS